MRSVLPRGSSSVLGLWILARIKAKKNYLSFGISHFSFLIPLRWSGTNRVLKLEVEAERFDRI
jgi:hypothetical protein